MIKVTKEKLIYPNGELGKEEMEEILQYALVAE